MKKLLSALFLFLFFCLPFAPTAHAKVYWIGRDIDMALQFGIHTKKDWRMFRLYGHSLLVIIPDNPAAFAKLYNPRRPQAYFTELEKDFGHGYKGFILAAYAERRHPPDWPRRRLPASPHQRPAGNGIRAGLFCPNR